MKRALADVLWEAANLRLWDGVGETPGPGCAPSPYSCDAVHDCFTEPRHRVQAKRHLADMGCPIVSTDALKNHRSGKKRQGVRYMWLLLAMHVAEDEGIEIEVDG